MEAYLTPTEAAKLLRIGRTNVYKLVKAGAIPSITFGPKSIRIPRTALIEYLENAARESVTKRAAV